MPQISNGYRTFLVKFFQLVVLRLAVGSGHRKEANDIGAAVGARLAWRNLHGVGKYGVPGYCWRFPQ